MRLLMGLFDLKKTEKEKLSNFGPKLSKNENFATSLIFQQFYHTKANFLSETSWMTILGVFNLKKGEWKQFQIFDQNHGLTP